MLEQRLVIRLENYWNRIKGEKKLPFIDHFDHSIIQDIWPNCAKLQILPGTNPPTLSYQYIGATLQTILDESARPGRTVMPQVLHLPTSRILSRADDAISSCAIVLDDGQFINDKSKLIKYRSCLLPFGNAQEEVTHLVAGISWRSF